MLYIDADDSLANSAIESLKQLAAATKPKDTKIAVALGVEGDVSGCPKLQYFQGYLFQGRSQGTALSKYVEPLFQPTNSMIEPGSLAHFISQVVGKDRDRNYCLILWGHGPELLFQGLDRPNGKRRYLTPTELRAELEQAQEQTNTKLEIIAMDACSMSLFEYAAELRGLARYMVASQEEIPDSSYPYEGLVPLFSEKERDPKALCRRAVELFVEAYQDYFYWLKTGMRPAMLSAIDLEKLHSIAEKQLEDFVGALTAAANDDAHAKAILMARSNSQGFVGGTFVDLRDFCEQLIAKPNSITKELHKASTSLRDFLTLGDDKCIFADRKVCINKQSQPEIEYKLDSCHGLSIYLPYLREVDGNRIKKFTIVEASKGSDGSGTLGGGKNAQIANLAAGNIQDAIRRQAITDIEEDYGKSKFEAKKKWDEFIRCTWSRILAKHEPARLDEVYSGEQVARNLLKSCTATQESKKNRTRAVAAGK
jgi:hypothetical protein